MFEGLSDKLDRAFKVLKGHGHITEINVAETLKDVRKALSVLPKNAIYFFTKADIPRALDEQILFQEGKMMYLTGKPYPTMKEAVSAAIKQAQREDCIYIGGSTFVVGEAILEFSK